MNLRVIGGIIGVVVALLLSYCSISKSWFTYSRGDRSFGAGPIWVQECDGNECESEALAKGAHGDEEVWAVAGLGYAGLASITSLLFLIFGIIAFTGKGGKGIGITAIVFIVLTNIAAGTFAGLKPSHMKELTAGLGMIASTFAGLAGIAYGVVMIIAGKKPAAAAAMAMPMGSGAPPGYPPQGMPPQAMPPQGYPPQGMPPQAMPTQGMPPQGYPQQPAPGMQPQGYPQPGAPQPGYPQPGMPPQGFPPQGPQGPGQNFPPRG